MIKYRIAGAMTVVGLVLGGCATEAPAAQTVTSVSITTTTSTTTATWTTTATSRTTATETLTQPAPIEQASFKIAKSTVCELMVTSADGTDGPLQELTGFVSALNENPSSSEAVSLARQAGTIADNLADLGNHSTDNMATNLMALSAFARTLQSVYAGEATSNTVTVSDIKPPALELVQICTG